MNGEQDTGTGSVESPSPAPQSSGERKFLTFALANEEYGLDISAVREIIGALPVTHIPQTPPSIRGVINLRGSVIPVVELRLRFGMDQADYTKETCYIVTEVERGMVGIAVDRVNEVLDIAAKDIAPPPAFGSAIDTAFILGIGKVGERVLIMLDIAKVLSPPDVDAVGNDTGHHPLPVAA